jgi:hypothetical protein
MTESQFVRSQEPHEISMPEGSHIAKSRSADPGEPIVRQLQVESEPLQIAQIIVDRKVGLPPPTPGPTLSDPDFVPAMPATEEVVAVVPVPVPVPVQRQPEKVEKAQPEPDADSSERLLHVKSENNKVRLELMNLEQAFSNSL